MTRLPVSTALVLSQTNPIWIALLSPFVLGRGPGLLEMAGIACGMVGVLLVQPPRGGETAAVLVALLSALATAIAMLGLHRLRSVDPRAIVAHFAGVAAVVAGLSLVLFPGAMRESPGIGDRVTWLLLLGVGISGTIGQVCLTKAYATGPPATVAVAGLAQVAFAIPFDLLIWRRAVTPLAALGFVLVLAPSAFLAIRGRMTRGEELAIPSEPTPG
jgi:drug/metabolite transporter (DMT)-like permease